MLLNHEYWCEPECTWQTNSINKTATSDRLGSWASRHGRGIGLVFNSLDCFTVRPILSTRLITKMIFWGWGGGGWWCSAPMHLLFGAVYQSQYQGRRGYLDVSNVSLVIYRVPPNFPTCFIATSWRYDINTLSMSLAFVRGDITGTGGFLPLKATDAALWCLRWSKHE